MTGETEKLSARVMSGKVLFIGIAVVIATSFIAIGLYGGHFLFSVERKAFLEAESEGEDTGSIFRNPESADRPTCLDAPFPVAYRHLSRIINENRQEIYILEINLADRRTEVFPVLSYDRIFGFEKLSGMALRCGAYAAVNGGFFSIYGEPSGMVVIDGELITMPSGEYPVLVINEGRAFLRQAAGELKMEIGGASIGVDGMNRNGKPGETVLYTSAYGTTDRAESEHFTAAIENGVVVKTAWQKGEAPIPGGGMLLAFFPPQGLDSAEIPIKKGDAAKLSYGGHPGEHAHAYECGAWIVRDGAIVIGTEDKWIGVTTNRDPRTAVGLKDETTLVLLTVDGRQPGYSAGLTGKELGNLLLELGVRDAAMLDGGASTEMVVEGRVVNRPSFKGQERPLGGALAVRVK